MLSAHLSLAIILQYSIVFMWLLAYVPKIYFKRVSVSLSFRAYVYIICSCYIPFSNIHVIVVYNAMHERLSDANKILASLLIFGEF